MKPKTETVRLKKWSRSGKNDWWAVRSPSGCLHWLELTKRDAIASALRARGLGMTWRKLYKLGHRCVKVTIVER